VPCVFGFARNFAITNFSYQKKSSKTRKTTKKKEIEIHSDEDTIGNNEVKSTKIENRTINKNLENELANPISLIKEKEKIEKLKLIYWMLNQIKNQKNLNKDKHLNLDSKIEPKPRKDSNIPSTSKFNTSITEDFLKELKDSLAPIEESFVHSKTSKVVNIKTENQNADSAYDNRENCINSKSLSQSVSQVKLSFKNTKKLPSTKLTRAPSIPRNLQEKFSINSISLKQTNSLIKYLVSQQSSKIDVNINKVARKSIGDFVAKGKPSSQSFDDCNEVEDLKLDSREQKLSLSSFF